MLLTSSCSLLPAPVPRFQHGLSSFSMHQFNRLPLSVTRAYLTRLKCFDSVYEEASICYRKKRSSKCFASSSSSGGNVDETGGSCIGKELEAIYARCRSWEWKGYKINYVVEGDGRGPALLLVHGFGASLGHWRRNIRVLAERYTVYAIDLLGFGASDKPTNFNYTMEGWAELLLDFSRDVIQAPTVLIGNSVGSLACLIAGSAPQNLVRGIVLLNCAGGMNNKAIVDDWRIKLFTPLLWLIDFLLNQRKIASALFERLKARENLMNVLKAVYSNKASVDDELIEGVKCVQELSAHALERVRIIVSEYDAHSKEKKYALKMVVHRKMIQNKDWSVLRKIFNESPPRNVCNSSQSPKDNIMSVEETLSRNIICVGVSSSSNLNECIEQGEGTSQTPNVGEDVNVESNSYMTKM